MSGKLNYVRLVLILVAALIVLGGGFALLYLLFGKQSSGLAYEQLSITDGDYDVSDNYLTYATDTDLVQVNLNNSRITRTHLESAIGGFGVSSAMTAVYSGSAFQIRNFDALTLSGTIRGVACGSKHCAVLRENTVSGLDSIVIFNASGETVGNSIDYDESSVVSFGFETGNGQELLWVISVNTQATMPVTTVRLYDYNNSGSMSYYPSFYEQSIEKLFFTADSVYLVGTQDIIRYAVGGSKEKYRVGIYGKEVLDSVSTGDHSYFLLMPRGGEDHHTLYVLALAEGDAAASTILTLYSGEEILNAFLQNGGIRIVTATRLLSYSYAGKNTLDIPLDHPACKAVKLDNTRFLLVGDDGCFITSTK